MPIDAEQYPASDAGIPLRVKFRMWVAAIVADQGRAAEEDRTAAMSPDAGPAEPGRDHPEPEPPPMTEDHPEFDPLPAG